MKYIDEINPTFLLSKKDYDNIEYIENLLKKIKINSIGKTKNKKTKAMVRSIHYSLSIEANSLSLNDVLNVCNNKQVLGKKDEVQEVRNAIELYENMALFDYKKEKDLLKAHKILMKGFNDDNGKYRNHGEGIKRRNKIIFYAPDSILVSSMMKDLFIYIKKHLDINPIILSSVFHYYFVYIHPFTDGNGRTARFWVSLMLTNYNKKFEYIPIEETLYKHQRQYYEAIDRCHREGDATCFVRFMIKTIKETLEGIINNTTQKTTQKTNTSFKLLSLLKENPSLTRKDLARKLNISEDGVKYQINKLKKEGLIKRVGSDRKGIWQIIN